MIEGGRQSQQVLKHVHFKAKSRLPKECKAFSQKRIAAMVQCATRRLSGGALSHLGFSADNLGASPADRRTLRKSASKKCSTVASRCKSTPLCTIAPKSVQD